jgi:NADH:ubiquinone oxidoreductase subunit H
MSLSSISYHYDNGTLYYPLSTDLQCLVYTHGIDCNARRVLLSMLIIGVFSTEERILLASVQHRSGPISSTLQGFSISLADGIKLYAKLDAESGSKHVHTVLFGYQYLLVLMYFYSTSLLYGISSVSSGHVLLTLLALEAYAILLLLPMLTMNDSKYAALSILRIIQLSITAEILMMFAMITGLIITASCNIDIYYGYASDITSSMSIASI